MNKFEKNDLAISSVFFIFPTIALLIGFFLYPYPPTETSIQIVSIFLFAGLIFLGIGFLLKEKNKGGIIKIIGWSLFSLFWAMQPQFLYLSEDGDLFNAAVCVVGVYVLMYIAYHEFISLKEEKKPSCLNWMAGGTFIAGIIYFLLDNNISPILKDGLIETVASHTTILLNLLGLESVRIGSTIYYNNQPINIIFACTAIQAMVLFIGMIGSLGSVKIKTKLYAIIVTVVPIYFLNLIRNASVIFLVGEKITSFNVAHNIIAKAGSLTTLIILLFIVFKIVPELYDEIMCVIDLPKRKGPLEKRIFKIVKK